MAVVDCCWAGPPPGSGRILPVMKIQPSSGTPSRKKPSSAAIHGVAKKAATERRRQAREVTGDSACRLRGPPRGRPGCQRGAISDSEQRPGVRPLGVEVVLVCTPGNATVAQSTTRGEAGSAQRPSWSRSTTIATTATAASAAGKLEEDEDTAGAAGEAGQASRSRAPRREAPVGHGDGDRSDARRAPRRRASRESAVFAERRPSRLHWPPRGHTPAF